MNCTDSFADVDLDLSWMMALRACCASPALGSSIVTSLSMREGFRCDATRLETFLLLVELVRDDCKLELLDAIVE